MVSFNPAITEKLNNLSNGLLSGHYIFSRDFDEKYLEKRYSAPEAFAHNITYGVSNDKHVIEQYYNIRQDAYRQVLGLEHFDGGHEPIDDQSYLYLVKAGNNCVGGVRLTISTPDAPLKLPLETQSEFSVQNLYQNIDLSDLKYCEASRLALLPEYRLGRVSDELINNFVKFLTDEIGVSLGFGRSTALQARRFKSQFQNLGLPYKFVIRNDITLPYDEGDDHLNLKFWSIDFSPDQRYAEFLTSNEKEKVKEPEFA